MRTFQRLHIALKALRQLGPQRIGLYAWYRLALRTGYLRWLTRSSGQTGLYIPSSQSPLQILKLPDSRELAAVLEDHSSKVFAEGDEILADRVRLFDGPPVPLELTPPGPLVHWTEVEERVDLPEQKDIKQIWEPARFGWAYTLARAYHLGGDERYAAVFWQYFEAFDIANPPYLGIHWVSAQEVALRLIALAFASQVFARSSNSTTNRMTRLTNAIASHAHRIPPTLSYSRAQDNNHLLSEAAGLYTAGVLLDSHPRAKHWRDLGSHWLNQALQTQIDADGTYVQQSTNYHRLVLQITLWVFALARNTETLSFPEATHHRLAAATRWLLSLIDTETGCAPNLGPNDGTYFLPLTICPFSDYRPVLQAAALAFLDQPLFPPGPWDEMAIWLGHHPSSSRHHAQRQTGEMELGKGVEGEISIMQHATRNSQFAMGVDYPVLHNPASQSWSYLRVARFHNRPGHADQLHLDLWWRGQNLAKDPGTYLYNAPPPWDNSLARTAVHNTITVEGEDQMTRAGRFLWLNWAQGEIVARERAEDGSWERLTARHDGYRRLGVIHQRSVEYRSNYWRVIDTLLPLNFPNQTVEDLNLQPFTKRIGGVATPNSKFAIRKSPFLIRLSWLLPDWPWRIDFDPDRPSPTIFLESKKGQVKLKVIVATSLESSNLSHLSEVHLARAGELLYGSGVVSPIEGWTSPTYGYKTPALSFITEIRSQLPASLLTEWTLPECTSS